MNNKQLPEHKKNGWIDEDNTTYHGGPGLSSTGLKLLCKSPRHWQKKIVTIDPEVARESSLIHTAFLEPHLLEVNCVTPPVGSRATKPVKILWERYWEELDSLGFLALPLDEVKKLKADESHLAYNDKPIVITGKDRYKIQRIQETLEEYPSYKEKLQGIKEQSGYETVEWKGMDVLCKVRPDVRNPEEGYMMDIKTSADCNFFSPDVFKRGYQISASYYLDLGNAIDFNIAEYKTFYWLVIEKEEPFMMRMFKEDINGRVLTMGRESYEYALDTYVDCKTSDIWPGYPERIENVRIPKYIAGRMD